MNIFKTKGVCFRFGYKYFKSFREFLLENYVRKVNELRVPIYVFRHFMLQLKKHRILEMFSNEMYIKILDDYLRQHPKQNKVLLHTYFYKNHTIFTILYSMSISFCFIQLFFSPSYNCFQMF